MIKFEHLLLFHVLHVTIYSCCPKHICIPEYFNLFNKRKQNLSKGKSTEYDDLKNEHGKPLDCIECGQCERVCPQKLPIISNLKKVADEFE